MRVTITRLLRARPRPVPVRRVPSHAADDGSPAGRLRTIGRQLRQGRPYSRLILSEESLGALIDDALVDADRREATLAAALDEVRAQLDEREEITESHDAEALERVAWHLWEWGRAGDLTWTGMTDRGRDLYRERAEQVALMLRPRVPLPRRSPEVDALVIERAELYGNEVEHCRRAEGEGSPC